MRKINLDQIGTNEELHFDKIKEKTSIKNIY